MIWSTRRLTRIGLVVCALLGATIFVWGSLARLAGAVIANGQIRVESYSQSIEHPDGGRVKDIFVKDGDFVEKGTLLVSLDRDELDINHKALADNLILLAARAARL
ncbi:MAG: biotin/lipoyl-binding protein, partial [Deltaproteobacteria bacterium]